MIVECPACDTIFPVDPQKVPSGGVHARCSVCSEVFFVNVPEPEADLAEPEGLGVPEEEAFEEVAATVEEADSALEEADTTFEEAETDLEEDTAAFEEEEDTEAAEKEPVEGFEEAVEDFVVESEPTFEEAVATFQEAEATIEEAEATIEEAEEAEVIEPVEEAPGSPPVSAPPFGRRDPMEKAQRLARVLVSDIILYNPDRHYSASESGRLKEEFEEEIQKSWNEYVEQVGEDIANGTNFFNDALNEILAKGEQLF